MGFNMFAYCLNNPVCLVDITGELAATATATAAAAASCNPLGLLVAIVVVGAIIVIDALIDSASNTQTISTTQGSSYDKSTGTAKNNKKPSIQSGQTTSPTPPKNPKNNRNNQYHGGTLYEDKEVHVDYEYNGNGTGNVHLQVKKGNIKYYYDSAEGVLRTGQSKFSDVAPRSVQKYLSNRHIQIALDKGIKIIGALGGNA